MSQFICLHLCKRVALYPYTQYIKCPLCHLDFTQSLSPIPYSHTTLIQTKEQNYCGHTYGFYFYFKSFMVSMGMALF
jgi:hypothetical protein